MKTIEMADATGPPEESLALATNPDFLALIERSRARCPAGSGISTEEMRRRLAAKRSPG